jgi:hypothetical protein
LNVPSLFLKSVIMEERCWAHDAFEYRLHGTVVPASRTAHLPYSTYRGNPPESDLIFQVTVIGLRNQRVCGSAFSLTGHTTPFAANPLH